eukprot:3701752-Prymnesium_polylepis.1
MSWACPGEVTPRRRAARPGVGWVQITGLCHRSLAQATLAAGRAIVIRVSTTAGVRGTHSTPPSPPNGGRAPRIMFAFPQANMRRCPPCAAAEEDCGCSGA